jgi:ribonuclease T2
MKKSCIALVIAVFLSFSGCKFSNSPANASATSTNSNTESRLPLGTGFDYYLLNLSWSPEFCYSHPNATECASHLTFVLHGLWPQNNDGTYPEKCSDAPGPADPEQYKDIYPDSGLLRHEWQTHGTCSGLSADAFLQTARTAVHQITIPPMLRTLTKQTSLPPDRIVSLFIASNPQIPASSFAVSCGHNYLTAIEVCMDKTLRPTACKAIRSCRANTVRIPAP